MIFILIKKYGVSDLKWLQRLDAVRDVVEGVEVDFEVLLKEGLVFVHGFAEGLHSFAPKAARQLYCVLATCHSPLDLPSPLGIANRTPVVGGDVLLYLRKLGCELAEQGLLFKQPHSKSIVGFDGILGVVEVDADNPHKEGEGKTGVGLVTHEFTVYSI